MENLPRIHEFNTINLCWAEQAPVQQDPDRHQQVQDRHTAPISIDSCGCFPGSCVACWAGQSSAPHEALKGNIVMGNG